MSFPTKSTRDKRTKTSQTRSRSRSRTPIIFRSAAPNEEVITIEDTPHSAADNEVITIPDTPKSARKPNRVIVMELVISSDDDEDVKYINDIKDDHQASNSSSSSKLTTSNHARIAGISSIKPNTADDVMQFADSIISAPECNNEHQQKALEERKSLQDYKNQTAKILKDASAFLEKHKLKLEDYNLEAAGKQESSPEVTVGSCPICFESLVGRSASVTVCGHIFCTDCIMKPAKILKNCPTCRSRITPKKIHPIYF